MTEFVESIRRGYERVTPLGGGRSDLPEAATISPWDGSDAQVGAGESARAERATCAGVPDHRVLPSALVSSGTRSHAKRAVPLNQPPCHAMPTPP